MKMEECPFLPLPEGMSIDQVQQSESQLTVIVISTSGSAPCPGCGCFSEQIHSRYQRTVKDLPCAGRRVVLRLCVRKFFCLTLTCQRKVFAERLPTLVQPWARVTNRLLAALKALGLAASAEVSERLAPRLGMIVKAPTLLCYLRSIPPPSEMLVQKIGIDDFALRRGDCYGTILVNLETGKPLDLLPDRTSDAVFPWLLGHQEIDVVSRDRANGYADAIKRALPHATQIADRFHLCQNLREHLQTLLDRRHTCLPFVEESSLQGSPTSLSDDLAASSGQPAVEVDSPSSELSKGEDGDQSLSLSQEESYGELIESEAEDIGLTAAERKKKISRDKRSARYEAIQALHRQGLGLRAMARELGVSRKVVRHFVTSASFPERRAGSGLRAPASGKLTPYLSSLRERWANGMHNASLLFRELQERGYSGSRSLVGRLLADWRMELPPKPKPAPGAGKPRQSKPQPARKRRRTSTPRPRRLSSRSAAYLLMTPVEQLSATKLHQREQLCQHEDLKLASTLAQEFRQMLKERQGERLADWLKRAKASRIPELKSFATGLSRDSAAVSAACSLPWSNGVVEGNINRLKSLKRQMFGRAQLDLLRIKVLHAV
jgi:transposase